MSMPGLAIVVLHRIGTSASDLKRHLEERFGVSDLKDPPKFVSAKSKSLI
jgi:hypothetical protein